MTSILLALVVAGAAHAADVCSLHVLIDARPTAGISTIAWTGNARWVRPGDEVLFRLHPTRRHPSAEPVVDVLPDAMPPGAADRAFRDAVERAFAQSERWRSTFPGSTILNGYRGR